MKAIVVLASLALIVSPRSPVTLTLTLDKTCYFVGEPVVLGLVVTNTGSEPAWGYWQLDPYLERDVRKIELQLCSDGSTCRHLKMPEICTTCNDVLPRQRVAAGGTLRMPTLKIAIDAQGKPVLSEPGRYVLRLAHWGLSQSVGDQGQRPTHPLYADIQLRVASPPRGEDDALNAYMSPALLHVTDYGRAMGKRIGPEDTAVALKFLRKYPHSLYAKPVIEGLQAALPLRVMNKNATDEEREAYEMFKRKEYADPYVPECP